MSRGRSLSPRSVDMDVDIHSSADKSDARVVIITNLTRNVVESHLKTIFGFYGHITRIDLPTFVKSGQNRGKAALEFVDSSSAHKAVSHMDGGQLDGSIVKVELSDLPIRSVSRSPARVPRGPRNGRDRPRSISRSRSISRTPPRRRVADGYPTRDSFRGRPYGRRGLPGRDVYRPGRSRSRSPVRRGLADRPPPPRRRSPSYSRGGYGRRRSRSYSVRSSRSRSSLSYSRSRSMSYSSDSRYSRSRTRSISRARRSRSRDDIRDSRSRSPGA